jgi:hypothetical protein
MRSIPAINIKNKLDRHHQGSDFMAFAEGFGIQMKIAM